MSIGSLLTQTAQRLPDAPAVTQEGITKTWSEVNRRADALGHTLRDLGLDQGDRVGMFLNNRPESLETMFAVFKAGFCLVPLNRRFTDEEVHFHLADSGARALVADTDDVLSIVDESGRAFDYEMGIAERRDRGSVDALTDLDDIAWLFYTSGTTGRPKGAALTHANLAFVVASWLADMTPMSHTDVTLHAAPLTHGAGFHALAGVARGAHHVLPPAGRFDPASILHLMREARVSNTWLVPTQIIMIVDHLGGADPDLPDLRHIVYGGAPFPAVDLELATRCLGDRLVHLYGQGETPMTITAMPGADHMAALDGRTELFSSAGYARPGMEVAIVDGHDLPVVAGAVGEVVVRGPAVMKGYWNQPAATAETLRGGWLHTGDLGRMNERGYLFLVGRAKDLIITGGSNVYPAEVERVLRDFPDVRDAAVVGVPDRKWGEIVAAVVVPLPGVTLDLEALGAHCAHYMSGYKQPRRFLVLGEMPRNAYGKVSKDALRQLFA